MSEDASNEKLPHWLMRPAFEESKKKSDRTPEDVQKKIERQIVPDLCKITLEKIREELERQKTKK